MNMLSDHDRQPWHRIGGKTLVCALFIVTIVACLCLDIAGHCAGDSPDRPKRILIIPSYNFDYKGIQWFLQGVMSEFANRKPFKVAFSLENLQLATHSSDRRYMDTMAASLKIKYSIEKPDLIIVQYIQALRFMARYGDEIFGDAPVIFAGQSIEAYNSETLPDNYTGILAAYSAKKNIDLILQNHPRVRKIYVVGGVSPVERSMVNEVITEGAPYREKVECIALTDMPFPALLAKLGNLSDDSVVIYQVMQRDITGKVLAPAQAAVEIAAAANVPVYGMLDTYMDSGITGGYLIDHEGLGRKAATIAIQWLKNGVMPDRQIKTEAIGSYQFDWRQLKRWRVDEKLLPSGSLIAFKSFSVWDSYKVEIIVGVSLFLMQTVLMIGMIWNRHKRIKTEEKLRESEEKYRNLFENANEAIFVAQDGRLVFMNPMTSAMIGYSNEELMARPFTAFIHPDDKGLVIDRHVRRMKGEALPHNYTFRINRMDGKVRFVELNTVVVNWKKKPATLNFLNDITERKRAEEEKQNLEVRLQRSEKMEALGQMAGGVAHDLNNVLGVLTGYSELLLGEIPKGQRTRGYAEKILQSTEKGAAIIQDLLTLARRGVTTTDVINLNGIVSDFFKTPMFEKMKDNHPRVTFNTEYDQNLLNIKCSLVHMEKTLMNLVSNAAESISGEGEVTVRTESRYLDKPLWGYDEVKEGDYAVLIVTDTGMGIPVENREKIFEPFYTKKTMGRSGTGLGLSIVWGTVKDHNGYIDVKSEVSKGTTFSLYFPVTREEATAQQQEPLESYTGRGESVLVVDDIAEQREVAANLLTRLGYNTHVVSSGEEAVEYLKANKADILVLDMIMAPGIDGLETYQRVLEINPKQRAILVSGFSETNRVREAQRLGAGAYVKKPYVMGKIGVAIRNELDRK
jgi:PAS domain S-box-containing protein